MSNINKVEIDVGENNADLILTVEQKTALGYQIAQKI